MWSPKIFGLKIFTAQRPYLVYTLRVLGVKTCLTNRDNARLCVQLIIFFLKRKFIDRACKKPQKYVSSDVSSIQCRVENLIKTFTIAEKHQPILALPSFLMQVLTLVPQLHVALEEKFYLSQKSSYVLTDAYSSCKHATTAQYTQRSSIFNQNRARPYKVLSISC